MLTVKNKMNTVHCLKHKHTHTNTLTHYTLQHDYKQWRNHKNAWLSQEEVISDSSCRLNQVVGSVSSTMYSCTSRSVSLRTAWCMSNSACRTTPSSPVEEGVILVRSSLGRGGEEGRRETRGWLAVAVRTWVRIKEIKRLRKKESVWREDSSRLRGLRWRWTAVILANDTSLSAKTASTGDPPDGRGKLRSKTKSKTFSFR